MTERNNGGHYAAIEDPEGIIEDVRELAAQEWDGRARLGR
jgi:hypothetical protein